MKRFAVVLAVALVASIPARIAVADEEFYGVIESLPENRIGIWIVGGRSFNVMESTELDEDHGPLIVGACVDVEIDDGVVEAIESEPLDKCQK